MNEGRRRGADRPWSLAVVLLLATFAAVWVVVLVQGDATTTEWRYSLPRLAVTVALLAMARVWRLPMVPLARRKSIAWPAVALIVLSLLLTRFWTKPFNGWGALIVFTVSMLSVGLFEELLTRGLVLGRLVRSSEGTNAGLWWAVWVSSVIFGLAHVVNLPRMGTMAALAQVIYASLIGLFFAAVRLRHGLWLAIGLHAALDWSFYLGSDVFVHDTGPSRGGGLTLLVVGLALGALGAWHLRHIGEPTPLASHSARREP